LPFPLTLLWGWRGLCPVYALPPRERPGSGGARLWNSPFLGPSLEWGRFMRMDENPIASDDACRPWRARGTVGKPVVLCQRRRPDSGLPTRPLHWLLPSAPPWKGSRAPPLLFYSPSPRSGFTRVSSLAACPPHPPVAPSPFCTPLGSIVFFRLGAFPPPLTWLYANVFVRWAHLICG